MRITIATAGTQGDIQPYLALGLGLQRAGYSVKIATTTRFEEFINHRGLGFIPIRYIDYSLESDHKLSEKSFEKPFDESSKHHELHIFEQAQKQFFRFCNLESWLPWNLIEMIPDPFAIVDVYSSRLRSPQDNFLPDLYEACQDSDAIIFAPHLFQGLDIAEALKIPCFAACVHPLSQTRAFPHLFTPISCRLGDVYLPLQANWLGAYHWLTYSFFDQLLWQFTRAPINQWRQEKLNLPSISLWDSPLQRMRQYNVPFLYGYSSAFLPKPPDWSENLHLTGYWFLDHSTDWQPPQALKDFLAAGPSPICIGFGSTTSTDGDSQARTKLVLEALVQTGQRGIFLIGWGGLSNVDLPDQVFAIESVPHDWLFSQVAAVVHHGGSGTTAAGLRAGVPSIIVPFDGDQFFWGQRVAALGLGPQPIPQTLLSTERLVSAIRAVTTNQSMRTRAATIAQQIQSEDGITKAVEIIGRDLTR